MMVELIRFSICNLQFAIRNFSVALCNLHLSSKVL